MTTLLHIDTDFAGDTDDACALAMVLGWPGADIVGITTTADPDGQRAGYVTRFLGLAPAASVGGQHVLARVSTLNRAPMAPMASGTIR